MNNLERMEAFQEAVIALELVQDYWLACAESSKAPENAPHIGVHRARDSTKLQGLANAAGQAVGEFMLKWGVAPDRDHDASGRPLSCAVCLSIRDEGGFGPSHAGSSSCQSGSIASGGDRAHCSCDVCF